MKVDPLDTEILETYKELNPSGAFILGFNDYAGKLFIPSKGNLREALRRVRQLRRKAKTELQKKVIDSFEVALLFDEPQPVLDDIVGTLFSHLSKEGVNEEHLKSVLSYASKALDATRERFSGREIPVAVKALSLYRLNGVLEILEAVKEAAKGTSLKAECERVKAKATDNYVTATYNGVAFSPLKTQTGKYTHFSYEHVYARAGGVSPADRQALAAKIVTAAEALAGQDKALLDINSMSVEKACDSCVVVPK